MYGIRNFGVTLVALLILPAVPAGQQTPWPTSSTFTTSGAFFALSVPDLEASIRWYSEKLGLRVVMRPPRYENTEVAVLEGGGLIVELLQRDDAVPARQPVHGFVKAGLVVDDFESTMAMLGTRRAEIVMGPFPAQAGQRANVIVRDNAGNMIQFFGRDVP